MSKRHIYIISDLHLGGVPARQTELGESIGFQMCPSESRRRLARFIDFIRTAHPRETTQLIINGDFIDFLAEEAVTGGPEPSISAVKKFDPFTGNPEHAVRKFERIVQRTDDNAPKGERVFEALRDFVGDGQTLTLLLGNHDIELSLPAVRRSFMAAITQGRPACVEFLYDGEAYTVGDLLVEHGNRYDGWNAIAYGVLRAYRSLASRNEPQQIRFHPTPGSRLVAEIMNPLKTHFKFIDLLKPENEAMIPVLAALDPRTILSLRNIVSVIGLAAEKYAVEPQAGRPPWDESYIADDQSGAMTGSSTERPSPLVYGDPVAPETVKASHALLEQAEKDWPEEKVLEDAMHVADDGVSFKEKVRGGLAVISQALPFSHPTYAALRRAFLSYRQTIGSTFDLQSESPRYLLAASRLAEGRRIVVFGHTHLSKRVKLKPGGLYLNSGTWCPTIQLPTDFYTAGQSEDIVLQKVKRFIEDLANNRTDEWCTLKTTFAKVTLEDNRTTGDVFEFRSDGTTVPC